jgi:hypothetical protein
MLAQDGQHTRVQAPWGSTVVMVAVSFATNASNVVTGFAHSATAANPVTIGGAVGSPEISPGYFKALRGVVRLSGPASAVVVATPDAGPASKLTVTTVLSQTYAFLFFLEV